MLKIFLIIGTFLMLAVTLYVGMNYRIQWWKTVLITIALTFSGLFGTEVLFWIEVGKWGGTSFFGAVFLVPLIMSIVSLILHNPIGQTLDMCAPAECIMLALMKVRCMYYHCCEGRLLFSSPIKEVRFPSQFVELVAAIVVMIILLRMIKEKKSENQLYAKYMILYGLTRFVLNLMRDTEPFVWILPAGNLWSLVSILVGSLWLNQMKRCDKGIYYKEF